MALEDEIINIEDLDIAKEIKIGDNILLETTDGTKLIDFKDFIIGTDNITFYDKISGGEFLQTADISALRADVATNTTILTDISGVIDNDIASLQGQVNALDADIAAFRADINGLSNVELSVSTTASVGVNASGAASSSGVIYFTTLHFSGTALATSGYDNGTVNIGAASDTFSYIANGSYQILLVLNLIYTNNRHTGRAVNILKNGSIISSRGVGHTSSRQDGLVIMQAIRVIAGDKITLSHNLDRHSIKSGDITITV